MKQINRKTLREGLGILVVLTGYALVFAPLCWVLIDPLSLRPWFGVLILVGVIFVSLVGGFRGKR